MNEPGLMMSWCVLVLLGWELKLGSFFLLLCDDGGTVPGPLAPSVCGSWQTAVASCWKMFQLRWNL